jgi:arylsulfatase
MFQRKILYSILKWTAGILPVAAGAQERSQPDILLILADDMGYSDLGCYGSEIHTPNLDRLAKEGIRFTRFYNAARCCPSRASLLTGLYPHQAGVGAMDDTRNPAIPAYQGYLNDHCVTLGEALELAGYSTFISGKWHVGKEKESMWPNNRGFQHVFSYLGGACSYYTAGWLSQPNQALISGTELYPLPDDFFMTDAITDFALKFIQETPKEKPLFGYVAYTAPHWPLQERPENIAKYKGRYDAGWDEIREQRYERMEQMGIIDHSYALARRSDGNSLVPAWDSLSDERKKDMARRMEVYAAQVDSLDQQVGRLVEGLKAAGRYENTLVLFLSDNGACAEPNDKPFGQKWINPDAVIGSRESFASYGRGWAEVSNVPFRYWKQKIFEGGIRTPLIAHWPDKITAAAGTINRQPGHIVDVMSTCLDIAGGKYPETFNGKTVIPAEGISFAPVFSGKPRAEHTVLAWEHFANRGILSGKWKLVAHATDSPQGTVPFKWELYDTESDPAESRNIAGLHPEVVQDLSRKYEQWADRVEVIENLRNWQRH